MFHDLCWLTLAELSGEAIWDQVGPAEDWPIEAFFPAFGPSWDTVPVLVTPPIVTIPARGGHEAEKMLASSGALWAVGQVSSMTSVPVTSTTVNPECHVPFDPCFLPSGSTFR